MSRTSSEPRPGSAARFRRAFVVLVTSLALLCGLFVALGYLQGPKLSSAQVDTEAVTTQPGQQLRLFANQSLAEVDVTQVTVTPAATVSVSTSGDVVAVQFDDLLRYATEYTVRVDGVTGASPSGSSALEYRFTTASPEVYYLEPDRVMRTTVGATTPAPVYSAPGIRDIAVVGEIIAVVRELEDGTSTLELVSPTEGIAETVPLPETGTISDFDASTVGASVGFVLRNEAGARTLYTSDFEVGRSFSPVADLGGEPLQVTGWRFIPGSTTFVALSTASTLFVADAAVSGPLSPLGQLTELGRVSRDGTTVTGRDALGPVAVSLTDGSREVLEFQPVGDGIGFVGDTEVLSSGDLLERVALDEGDGSYRIVVAVDNGSEARIVYDGGGAVIDSFSLSPNSQYVALELAGTQTVIVDIGSGAVIQTLPGTNPLW